MCHTDLQQDISRASFSRQIERVLFRASFSYEFLVRLSWALVALQYDFDVAWQFGLAVKSV